jgi:hypothetical protein
MSQALPWESPTSVGTQPDRRAALRHRASFQAPCWLAAGGPVWKGYVRNLSVLGIGMIVPEKVEAGDLIHIDLRRRADTPVRRILARVVHVNQEEGGWWFIGCEFAQPLNDEELRELVQ